MADAETRPSVYHFGNIELDTRSGELRKNGIRIRLQDQPLQILLLLLDRPGELVSREEIQKKLWPDGTFVDYDNAINTAVRKLREALGDDSGDRRFVETFSRRGYRFIGNLEEPARPPQPEQPRLNQNRRQHRLLQKSRKGLVAAACGAVLVVVAAAGWWLWQRPATEIDVLRMRPVPLTAAPGIEGQASFSPDGNEVAYSWDEGKDGVSHIYIKLIGSGKPLRLTSGQQEDRYPTWSPDGRSIAFLRSRGDDINGPVQLDVVPALGGAERLVTAGYIHRTLAWSPDSRFLAVAEKDSPEGIISLQLVRAENGERIRLTTPPIAGTEDSGPAFSPNGRILLFRRVYGGWSGGLYLLDLSTNYRPAREPQVLREVERRLIRGVAWTNDGKDIIYGQEEDYGIHGLMRIHARIGAQPEPLTPSGENAYSPVISPRGNRLAYTKVLSDSDLWQIRPGSAPRRFASSTRDEDSPQYSPDGEHVAFVSYRSAHSQIWVCDKDGGNPAQLTHDDSEAAGTPRWSPDGRWIAFDGHLKEGKHILVMAPDGSQARRLTPDDGIDTNEGGPSWSQDGKWVYFACTRSGRFEIWKAPAQGGKGIQVTHHGAYVGFESRDARTLYYIKGDSSALWALSIRGGEENQVLASIYNRAFAVLDDGIYYIPKPAERGHASVRFHRFATNEDREIAAINQEPYLGLTVSPDRKSILVTAWNPTRSENIMIVDNFR